VDVVSPGAVAVQDVRLDRGGPVQGAFVGLGGGQDAEVRGGLVGARVVEVE
jgi:hypothetical protein